MYGIVLMAAMATTSATPEGCWGCGGGGLFHRWGGCHGCSGSYGCGGCYGCCGGCYGCGGGCYGGCGGCFGGCGGCYGGCMGSGCGGGCYGWSYGCNGYLGYSPYFSGYVIGESSVAPPLSGTIDPAKAKDAPKKTGMGLLSEGHSRLVVELPADAKLYVDDQLVNSAAAAHREFNTPKLDEKQVYYYVVRAEVERNGTVVSQSKRVIVQPGKEAVASFADLDRDGGVASRR